MEGTPFGAILERIRVQCGPPRAVYPGGLYALKRIGGVKSDSPARVQAAGPADGVKHLSDLEGSQRGGVAAAPARDRDKRNCEQPHATFAIPAIDDGFGLSAEDLARALSDFLLESGFHSRYYVSGSTLTRWSSSRPSLGFGIRRVVRRRAR